MIESTHTSQSFALNCWEIMSGNLYCDAWPLASQSKKTVLSGSKMACGAFFPSGAVMADHILVLLVTPGIRAIF